MMMSMSRKIPQSFWNWCDTVFKEDVDKIDVEAHYDSTLSVEENKTEFKNKFPLYFSASHGGKKPTPPKPHLASFSRVQTDTSSALGGGVGFLYGKAPKLCIVLADTGGGKTALSHRICDVLKAEGRPVYVYRHPRPKLIEGIGYETFKRFDQINDLRDAVVWIDEPQLHFDIHKLDNQRKFLAMLSLLRQRRVTVILTTSDSRYCVKAVESYVDCWFIKDLQVKLLKNGTIVKSIIDENQTTSLDEFRCATNEFLFYSRRLEDFNGKHTFSLPDYWSEEFSVPYY